MERLAIVLKRDSFAGPPGPAKIQKITGLVAVLIFKDGSGGSAYLDMIEFVNSNVEEAKNKFLEAVIPFRDPWVKTVMSPKATDDEKNEATEAYQQKYDVEYQKFEQIATQQ